MSSRWLGNRDSALRSFETDRSLRLALVADGGWKSRCIEGNIQSKGRLTAEAYQVV
jgi:hypothetical protein